MLELEAFGLEGLEASKGLHCMLPGERCCDLWMHDPWMYDSRLYAHSLLWIFWKCVMGCLGGTVFKRLAFVPTDMFIEYHSLFIKSTKIVRHNSSKRKVNKCYIL